MAKVSAQEVMTAFNSRTMSGRVVINPPERMPPLRLHDTESMYFCCGTAFLTEESYQKHRSDTTGGEHDEPIDMKNVRRAINLRSSDKFWRTKKATPTKTFTEQECEEGRDEETAGENDKLEGDEGVEDVEKDADADDGGGDEEEEVAEPKPSTSKPRKYAKSKRWSSKKKRGNVICEECKLNIPVTNIRRHMRVCHNPGHEFACRYCSCRFEVAYGRMVHEVKNHRSNANFVEPVKAASLKVKKKLIKPAPVPVPPREPLPPRRVKAEPPTTTTVPAARNLVPTLSEEQMANFHINITRLEKTGGGDKARFECNICHKTFLGSRNAQDHLNSHYGLKPFMCPLCSYSFSFRSNVARHIKTCHAENSDFVCPYGCGCAMQSEASLKIHINLVCALRHQFQESKTAPKPQQQSTPRPPTLKARPIATVRKIAPKPEPAAEEYMSYDDDQSDTSAIRFGKHVLKEKYQHCEVSPGIYLCEQCNKTITGSGNFRDHLNVHANIRPHKCPKCYMFFTFKSNIRRHLNSAHVPNGRFKCPMKCGCAMDNSHALQSHLNKCKIEMVKYKRRQQTAAATKIKTEQVSQQQSPSRLPPPPPLRKIMPRPPPLTPAPSQFSSSPGPSFDSFSMPDSPSTKYQCTVCNKTVSCQRNLHNHMLIHMNVKPCRCLICGLHFRTMDTLKKHRAKSHAVDSKFKCDKCPCRFSQLQGLTMHTTMHHNTKPKSVKTAAPISSRSFQEIKYEPEPADELNEEDDDDEMMANTNDDEYNGQIVTPRVDLDKARTKDGNWKCPLCGKLLKKGLHLQNHMRIHSGEKPHKCLLCGARFRLASTLYDHKKSSHRGGNYKCSLCTCTFETNLGLSRHKGIFHNVQAHDYIQRKIRHIREKAVKSVFYNKHTPPMQDRKPVFQNNAMMKQNSTSILKNRLIHQHESNSSEQTFQKPRVPIANNKPQVVPKTGSSIANSMFQCGHCGLMLPSLNALSEHQLVHQASKAKAADKSPTVPVQIKSPAQHHSPSYYLQDPTASPRSCPICNQSIHGRTHYNKHMTGCHSGGPFVCLYCPCSFDSQGNLSRHHTLIHPSIRHRSKQTPTNSSPVAVKPTPKPVVNPLIPEVTYEDDETFQVEQDQEGQWEQTETSDTFEVQKHTLSNNGSKLYTCADCGKTFDKLNRYRLHITVHSNIKPYNCSKCSQSFRLPGILATHIKKSHGSGQYRCQLCPSRFTSAKGLSVHEFVFHKGGRLEREVGREQSRPGRKTAPQKFLQVPKSVPQKVVNNINGAKSLLKPTPTRTSAYSQQQQQPMYSTAFPSSSKTIVRSSTMSLVPPRPVKLKCHICAQIFLGTNNLQEHMKEHTRQPIIRHPRTISAAPPRSAVNSFRMQQSAVQRLSNGPSRYIEEEDDQSTSHLESFQQEMYEEQDDQGTFEIVGYENCNGYEENPSSEEMEGQYEDAEYQYEDQGYEDQGDGGEEEYYGDDGNNYDYMNADDHLEIVHETSNFNYDENENGEGFGVEVQMEEESGLEGQDEWGFDAEVVQDGEEQQTIECKGCGGSFETKDAFAYHVENDNVSGGGCGYCCTPGITAESLPSHIEQFHPFYEIEFLESQVYGDS